MIRTFAQRRKVHAKAQSWIISIALKSETQAELYK